MRINALTMTKNPVMISKVETPYPAKVQGNIFGFLYNVPLKINRIMSNRDKTARIMPRIKAALMLDAYKVGIFESKGFHYPQFLTKSKGLHYAPTFNEKI